MESKKINPEWELCFSYYQDLPGFPHIGELFNLMAKAGDLFEKEDPDASKKRMELLRFQAENNIDLDKAIEFRKTLIAGWNKRLDGLGNHWLDPAQWMQIIDAYAEMTRQVSVGGAPAELINLFAITCVAAWFAVPLFNWSSQKRNDIPSLYSESLFWWLPSDTGASFHMVFQNLKQELGLTDASDYELAKTLNPDLHPSTDKDSLSTIARQLKAWSQGRNEPEFFKLKEIKEKLLKIGKPLLARHFHENCVAVQFGIDFIKWAENLMPFDTLETIRKMMQSIIDAIATGTSSCPFIPSPKSINNSEEVFKTYYQVYFRVLLEGYEQENDKEGSSIDEVEKATAFIIQSIIDSLYSGFPDQGQTRAILEFYDLLRYTNGPLHSWMTQSLFDQAKRSGNKIVLRHIHSHQIFECLAITPYAHSQQWYKQKQAQYLPDTSIHTPAIDIKQAQKWIMTVRRDRVDQWAKWGRFNRTRLMLAISINAWDSAERLLDVYGADPAVLSKSKANQAGDLASPLILVLQKLPAKWNSNDIKGYEQLEHFALRLIGKIADSSKTSLNAALSISNRTPLSVAIAAASVAIVQSLVDQDVNLEHEADGDERTALYLAVDSYFKVAFINRHGLNAWTKEWDLNGADINMARLTSPGPSLSTPGLASINARALLNRLPEDLASTILQKSVNVQFATGPDVPARLSEIIEILLRAGADPNKLQNNNRYPLDLAEEIHRKTGDIKPVKILESYGAYKRVFDSITIGLQYVFPLIHWE